jgi:hypothetical protein
MAQPYIGKIVLYVDAILATIPQKGNLNNEIDMKSLFKFPFLGNGRQV